MTAVRSICGLSVTLALFGAAALAAAMPAGIGLTPTTRQVGSKAGPTTDLAKPDAVPATGPVTRPTTRRLPQTKPVASIPATQTRANPTTAPRAIVAAPLVPLPSFSEPAISPDGSEIAFVSGGDIWTVAAAGGQARLLISHPANESRPRYSPDGKKLAFISTRTGNGDIYVLTFDTGELKRLTADDGREELDRWSADGKWIYFSTTAHDVGGTQEIYRVSAEGGTPMPVVTEPWLGEFHSAPSPDGQQLAFAGGGNGGRNWARNGHDHSDECDIWLMTAPPNGAATPSFSRVTTGGDKNLWPIWLPNSRGVYYVSDHRHFQNLWLATFDPKKRSAISTRQVTQFKSGRVLFPDITPDGTTIVFERNFGIWKMDTATETPSEVPIHLRGSAASPGVEHMNYGSSLSEMAIAPDSRKVAFIAHGEVFATSRDGGEGVRISRTVAIESHVTWSHDSKRLVYVSNRDGVRHLFLYDFALGREFRITSGAGDDTNPIFSPMDDRLALQRDGKDLILVDIYSRKEVVLARGQVFDRPPFDRSRSPYAWSPKGDWIAFISSGPKGFDNVYIVPTSTAASQPLAGVWPMRGVGKELPPPRQVTYMANAGSNVVSWSADGTFLLFGTGQRTEEYQMARVDLIPRTPRFREDLFRDLFREVPRTTLPGRRPPNGPADPLPPAPATLPATTQPATAPVSPILAALPFPTTRPESTTQIVFENIRQRLTLLPINGDIGEHVMSPDGKTVLFAATSAGQQNLYTYSLDESGRDGVPRQLTSTGGYKQSAQFSPDGREVYFVENGRLSVVPLDTRISRPIGVSAEMDVDFAVEKHAIFYQAWQYLRDNFFDPHFNGLNWEAVGETYRPRVAGARTPDELRRLLALMVGELNSSHVGAYAAPSGRYSVGRLGVRVDRAEYENTGRMRVVEVVPLGPAAVAGVKTGDYIVAVDRVRITNRINLEEVLDQKIGRRVTLMLTDRLGQNAREVPLLAIDFNTERALMYRGWVEDRRQYVDRISGGRLGYVHILDMTETALARLNTDLDSENQSRDGIVIDIRNNHGGFVNGFAIDIFARRNYLTMSRRGYLPVPARTMLGQRAIGVPSVLVTNRFTISDAEDFTEGFRFLKLGKVVGEPTAGAVVFTSNVTLIDGTTFRIPETLVTANDGKPLEMNPRPVDIAAAHAVGESYTGHDVQLDAAVTELLRQIGTAKPGNDR